MTDSVADVVVIGGGVAGRSAAIFTARAGLETRVVSAGESILARNAHLENYPGFPGGVDARRLLSLQREQAESAGATFHEGEVVRLEPTADGFLAETADGDAYAARYVVAATKNATDFLDPVPGAEVVDRGKTFVATDERGRTGEDGLYAAGRLAGKAHQAIVAAGHGAEVAVTLLEDADVAFYHDWVAPAGYFTGRDRDVPPGCEEIEDDERRRREREAREALRGRLEATPPGEPTMHPSVADEE